MSWKITKKKWKFIFFFRKNLDEMGKSTEINYPKKKSTDGSKDSFGSGTESQEFLVKMPKNLLKIRPKI